MSTLVYKLSGTAKDVEAIARLRPWIEDEVKDRYCNFQKTKLYTDYDSKNDIFSFEIQFYK